MMIMLTVVRYIGWLTFVINWLIAEYILFRFHQLIVIIIGRRGSVLIPKNVGTNPTHPRTDSASIGQ